MESASRMALDAAKANAEDKKRGGKRKIKRNVWGNINGYVGGRREVEFGTDEIAAGHWLVTGEVDFNAGWSDENIKAAREAAKTL